jgi:lipoprotein Spr
MANMTVKPLLISLLSLVSFTSCKQFKSLTARDSSTNASIPKVRNSRQVRFIEDISVTPGQMMTSRHNSIGPKIPKSLAVSEAPKGERSTYGAGDIARGEWLQVKYALILNAAPENLTNTGLLKLIDEWWATPYSMGGTSKSGIDCSALTQLLMGSIYGVSIPRNSNDQYKASEQIEDSQLQEGDLVFFHTNGRAISHVGMYLTNNKFVHASTSQGVVVSDLNESYWRSKYKGAGRARNY